MKVAIVSSTFLLILGLLVLGYLLHLIYLDKIYNKLLSLSGESSQLGILSQSGASISKEILLKELYTPQGSNFNALAISAWSLFFIALAYFYFLTPSVFENYNYFKLAPLASSLLGFFVFGFLILLLTVVLSVGFSRIYGFYEISTGMKTAIMLTFVLLAVSIICSTYIGTIYPGRTYILPETAAFATLLTSQLILLAPIYIGTAKVMR
jgi:hypothetical protein